MFVHRQVDGWTGSFGLTVAVLARTGPSDLARFASAWLREPPVSLGTGVGHGVARHRHFDHRGAVGGSPSRAGHVVARNCTRRVRLPNCCPGALSPIPITAGAGPSQHARPRASTKLRQPQNSNPRLPSTTTLACRQRTRSQLQRARSEGPASTHDLECSTRILTPTGWRPVADMSRRRLVLGTQGDVDGRLGRPSAGPSLVQGGVQRRCLRGRRAGSAVANADAQRP